jgi:hypothetical protein
VAISPLLANWQTDGMAFQALDGNMKLSNSTLRESLSAAYAEIAAIMRGLKAPQTEHLYRVEIPGSVFDIAIGAGWIPLVPSPDDTTPPSARTHGKKLVQFGEFDVERWYVDSFVALLEDEIEFSSYGPEETVQARLDGLPSFTNKIQREELLQEFLSNHLEANKKLKFVQVAQMAGVDYGDFKRWRRGHLPDSSAKSKRLSLLLRYNDQRFSKRPLRRAET